MTIGIYEIKNRINGKMYIGQSSNIERRFAEHVNKTFEQSRISVDAAIDKYGAENFDFNILEECSREELNLREAYWIKELKAKESGYNLSDGGDFQSIGSNNGRALLNEQQVVEIRKAYNSKSKTTKEVYKDYEHLISYPHFMNIWRGAVWSHIMPEVLTAENKEYYSKKASVRALSAEEVFELRELYVTQSAKEIYENWERKNEFNFQTLQGILWGRHYKDVPIYSKKKKQWL